MNRYLLIIIALYINSNSYSQNLIIIHVTGGYDVPLPDFKGSYPDDITKSPERYYMKSGFNEGIDMSYHPGVKRNFGITLSLGYYSFSSADVALPGSSDIAKNRISIFAAGMGVKYVFMAKKNINPFAGIEVTGNFFSGNSTIATNGAVIGTSLEPDSRFGCQINAGVDINSTKDIGFIIGLRYNIANLIGKDSVTAPYALQDKGSATVPSRNISYISFYGGVSFYFGRPKTTMKK